MDEYITKMINAGYSPDEIFEKAKIEFEKQKAAKEKLKKQKQLEKARKEMIAATANYVEALDPSVKLNKEDLQEIDKAIAELEAGTTSNTNKPKYDDPIFTFLEKIGAI